METRKKMAADNNNIDHNHAALLPRPWHLAPLPLPPPAAAASVLLTGAPFPSTAVRLLFPSFEFPSCS